MCSGFGTHMGLGNYSFFLFHLDSTKLNGHCRCKYSTFFLFLYYFHPSMFQKPLFPMSSHGLHGRGGRSGFSAISPGFLTSLDTFPFAFVYSISLHAKYRSLPTQSKHRGKTKSYSNYPNGMQIITIGTDLH